MHRTQIYLGDEEDEFLAAESERSGVSRSELIRRAVRSYLGGGGRNDRVARLQSTAGAWEHYAMDGASYVDSTRGDSDERLCLYAPPDPRLRVAEE